LWLTARTGPALMKVAVDRVAFWTNFHCDPGEDIVGLRL
jgi:hypothetical protein